MELNKCVFEVLVVLAGNFDVDLETLLVVLQRSLVLTLAVVNSSDVALGRRHVWVIRSDSISLLIYKWF